jgi:hypothetical protein
LLSEHVTSDNDACDGCSSFGLPLSVRFANMSEQRHRHFLRLRVEHRAGQLARLAGTAKL